MNGVHKQSPVLRFFLSIITNINTMSLTNAFNNCCVNRHHCITENKRLIYSNTRAQVNDGNKKYITIV